MQLEDFFHWAGEQLGRLIRIVVAGLSYLFNHLFAVIDSFYNGLTNALGMNSSLLNLLVLILGLLLLYAGLRSLLRRRLLGALIWAALGVFVLGWLIH